MNYPQTREAYAGDPSPAIPSKEGLRIGSGFVAFTLVAMCVAGMLLAADQRDLAAYVAGFWAVCVVLASPRAGVVLVLTIQVWDVVLNPAEGSGYEWISPGRALSILTVLSYLARWLAGHRWRIHSVRVPLLLFVAFAAWGVFSVAWAMDQRVALWTVLKLSVHVSLAIVAVDLLADRKALWQTLLLMAMGGAAGGLYALLGGVAASSEAQWRLAVGGLGVNTLGISIGTMLVSAMALLILRRSLLVTPTALASFIPMMLVALRTGTRSVLIGVPLAVALGTGAAYWRKLHKLFLVILVVGGISGGSLYWALKADFIKGRLRDRVLSVFDPQTYEANIRLALWSEALSIYAKNPLGAGAGNEKGAVNRFRGGYGPMEAHNAFLSVLVEYNVIGLGLFLGGLGFLAFPLLRVQDRRLRAAAAMLLVFALLTAMKGSIQASRLFWQPMLLAMTMIEADYRMNRVERLDDLT